ncbi:recombinase RecT [Sphingobacterium siyangense]|uniref:recombinase RecT n=1 Tax=Sphingobacterium siyangense TaxID=459529 RepID=UPI003DA2150C
MSNQSLELTAKYIKALSPVAVATDKVIGEHFVQKFKSMYRVSDEQAVAFYEREKDNFAKRISENDDLKACTPLSLFTALMQCGGWKLSLDGGAQADVYLIPGNRKVQVEGRDVWIKECVAQPSPYGEKKIRVETGQVKHVGNPTVVYDCDTYREFDHKQTGRRWVEWERGQRNENSIITNGFILLEYPDGTKEYKTYDHTDIESWEKASAKKNKGHANTLYGYTVSYKGQGANKEKVSTKSGQIDKKFFEGKILKHAFKLLPRVISDQKLPENFVPEGEIAVRQGFDVSEFTEDIDHVEVPGADDQDEFTQALSNDIQDTEVVETTIIADDDDPDFSF